jgi:outer membrane protein OmpA-like peptidoglycan-associated protein
MSIRTIIFCALCLTVTTAGSQTLNAYIEAAENAMAEKDFNSAYVFYGIAVDIDSARVDLRFHLADAAREWRAYSVSEEMYRSVMNDDTEGNFAETAFWLAQVQHVQGDYDSAIASYQIYLGEHADEDSLLTREANRLIASCQWAKDNQSDPDDEITIDKLDSTVNTSFSEVGALKADEILYFTRLGYARKDVVKKRKVPPSYLYSKVLSAPKDSIPMPLDSILNDSLDHTAHTTFNHDGSRVYYTVCQYLNRSDIQCDIYFRDIVEGEWGEAQKLPSPINIDTFTNTQPSIAYDDNLGKDVLYFVSDRDEGQGGLDIWYSVINDNNTFTEPVNFSEINTEYDELTPFFHEESNILYFSSNGREGFGAYDMFSAEQDGTIGWLEPVNLGSQYNSSFNDVYFSLNEDESYGMFSSNKVGSLYLDSGAQACCYDVYKAEKEPIEVKMIVETYNEMTGEPLDDVTLYIEHRNGEVVQVTQTTGSSNRYEMDLRRNKQYTVTGEKRTFNPATEVFSTYDIKKSKEIVIQLYLDPSDVIVEVHTYDKRKREQLVNVNVAFLDANGLQLGVKTNRYSNITYFSAPPDANYALIGTRKGYRKASVTMIKSEFIGHDTLVKELYLELGNLEDFLPLAIYFDNDKPNPGSRGTATKVRYLQTYDAYYAKKQGYTNKYSKGLTGAEAEESKAKMVAFFDDGLKLGREEFESFLNILDQYLEEELSFKIFLKGYASPLASSEYNAALGERRINTIQNEFAAFRGGVLKKYFDSGDLEVEEKSFGDSAAPANVSDDARNVRKSIYSPEASRERRVEIIEIQKDIPQR